MEIEAPRTGLDALYREVFEAGVRYCLPNAELTRVSSGGPSAARLAIGPADDGGIEITWLGEIYRLSRADRPLTESETRLLRSIGLVLSARYRVLRESAVAAETLDLFRGLPEDRFVSAYLDPSPYSVGEGLAVDRIASAIEVLRTTSSATYENRRINTGVLLVGGGADPSHSAPAAPDGALSYSQALTATRTFYRLSDGMRTVALVDSDGRMVELVDIADWAAPYGAMALPAPCAARFIAHCRATLCGGHVCLVLTPNGEIKAFADGMQVFTFLDGRWRLSDVAVKYHVFERAVAHTPLAERLFTTALNLAERRRGGLFVVLEDRAAADDLVAVADRLDLPPPPADDRRAKERFHYLLRDKSVLDLTPTVLESIARIDGAIVLDRTSALIAFGAILRLHVDPAIDRWGAEGGRTTAAIVASRRGHVLKVSEDGLVSFYAGGACVWEL